MKKSDLSAPEKLLIEKMQRLNFGKIEGLVIRNGKPVLDNPAPRVIRDLKFAGDNEPRHELHASDFALKAQVVDMLSYFRRAGDATVDLITVKHGLPFGMMVQEELLAV